MILLSQLIRTLSCLFMIRTQTRNVYILLKQIYWPQLNKGETFQLRKDNRSLSHDEDGGSENVAESEFASFPFFHFCSLSLRQPLLAVSHLLTAATKIFMHFFFFFFVSFFFCISRSSSFSVIHVVVEIRIKSKKRLGFLQLQIHLHLRMHGLRNLKVIVIFLVHESP